MFGTCWFVEVLWKIWESYHNWKQKNTHVVWVKQKILYACTGNNTDLVHETHAVLFCDSVKLWEVDQKWTGNSD